MPTATDNTVTATEDTAFVFALADFGFADVETDQLQSITVTTLNATGTLLLDGSAVTIGQTISQSDISAGALTFTPLANDNGAGYDSFAYTVNDGVADSLASATMTIDVTAVNDLPTALTTQSPRQKTRRLYLQQRTLGFPTLKRISCRALPSRRWRRRHACIKWQHRDPGSIDQLRRYCRWRANIYTAGQCEWCWLRQLPIYR